MPLLQRGVMTEFEFVTVMISMIIGLGLAHLLRGVAQAVHDRGLARLDPTHLGWTATLLAVFVVNWWALFTWRTVEGWRATTFLVLILWAISMYLPAVLLYPPRKAAGQSWADLYEAQRKWLLGAFLMHGALDIWSTALRGDLLNPPAYLPLMGHVIVLGVIGLLTPRPGYHRFIAWYFAVLVLVWVLLARPLLG